MSDTPLKTETTPLEARAPQIEPLLLNLVEAAALLNLPPSTLRTWAWARKVPCVYLGRRRLFRRADLERWIDLQTRPALPTPVDSLQPIAYRRRRGCPSDGKEGG